MPSIGETVCSTYSCFVWVVSLHEPRVICFSLQIKCLSAYRGEVLFFQTNPIFRQLLPAVITWWRHQMETFSALLALCAGHSPVTGEFSAQRPVTRSFDVFFDLRLNKGLCKQSWGWWFETPSRSLWRHFNDLCDYVYMTYSIKYEENNS